MSHINSHMHLCTCAHSQVSFFFLKYTLLKTVTRAACTRSQSLSHSCERHTETEKGRKRKKEYDIPPGDFSLLVPCFYFSTRPFFIPFTVTHKLTCSHCTPHRTPTRFSLKNKKYCCTCRQAAQLVFSLFFLHPLVQRAVNFDRC